MTEVAFHFGAADKLAYACRLLRKAAASGARLSVVADSATLTRLDAALWAVGATDFVSHCQAQAPAGMQARSAVLLTPQLGAPDPSRQVLVNLGAEVPDGFEDFARVIEVVSADEDDRQRGRQRWKQYSQQGYTITRHDLVAKGGNA